MRAALPGLVGLVRDKAMSSDKGNMVVTLTRLVTDQLKASGQKLLTCRANIDKIITMVGSVMKLGAE
jgi:hypothetical protein